MNYLDYLPETSYEDLPQDVQDSIVREEYEHLRALAGSMAAPPALPPTLSAALAAKVGTAHLQSTQTTYQPAFWKPLAIASSVLSLVLAATLWWVWPFGKTDQPPTDAAPAPVLATQPTIVRDTIEQLRVDTIVQYRTETKVLREIDTIYLKPQAPIAQAALEDSILNGSRSMATGANWQALTVRGAGELIRGR
jgi:hypothetical protein